MGVKAVIRKAEEFYFGIPTCSLTCFSRHVNNFFSDSCLFFEFKRKTPSFINSVFVLKTCWRILIKVVFTSNKTSWIVFVFFMGNVFAAKKISFNVWLDFKMNYTCFIMSLYNCGHFVLRTENIKYTWINNLVMKCRVNTKWRWRQNGSLACGGGASCIVSAWNMKATFCLRQEGGCK